MVCSIMAAKKPTDSPPAPQTPGDIAGLAERLIRHADGIRNPAAKALGEDLRLAARTISRWRVGIQDVIQHTHEEATGARLIKLVEGA
jgi:hypothetical protein